MQHGSNRAMMRRKPGDLNDIAYRRSHKACQLSHPNFAEIKRGGPSRLKLIRERGGVKTYA